MQEWSAERGFLRAPVSYDGVLIDAYGGGVCQTSSTVYNAALLAGLAVLERHPHSFSPSYVPLGRDAAVAYANVDFRVRNPYPWPVTLHIHPAGDMLFCQFEAERQAPGRRSLSSQRLDRFDAPSGLSHVAAGARGARRRPRGRASARVLVYRDEYRGGARVGRELISDDTYLPIP